VKGFVGVEGDWKLIGEKNAIATQGEEEGRDGEESVGRGKGGKQ